MMIGNVPRVVRISLLCCLIATASAVYAQQVQRFDGYPVVRVTVENEGQLVQLERISETIWSEHVGVGPLDILMDPAKLPELDRLGLAYVVRIPDVQVLIDRERAPRALVGEPSWFDEYKTYDQINAYMDDLVALRPDLISKYQIGSSFQGRPIYGLTVTSPAGGPDKPALCFNTMAHSREWIGPMTVMYIVDRLVRYYDSDAVSRMLLDRLTFYIVPVSNPDGYIYSWDTYRMWRKTRRNNGDGTYGVDWNRNWDFGWGGTGSSGNTNSDTYRGTAPFSEPETRALRDYLLAHTDIVTHIDFHAYGQLLLRPYGHEYLDPPEPDLSILTEIGDDMSQAIFGVHGRFYVSEPSYNLYLAGGCSSDWVYGAAGIYSYTIELRDSESGSYDFILPPEQIIPTAEENFEGIRALGEYFVLALKIELPEVLPAYVSAAQGATIPVAIYPGQEEYQPGSGLLHYRFNTDDPFNAVPLIPLGGDDFQAIIPPGPCDSTVEYYLSADGDAGTQEIWPRRAPEDTYAAQMTGLNILFADDFETQVGWTVQNSVGLTDGDWGRGIPLGGGDRGDPPTDFDGSGQCYLTDNVDGNSDVDGGYTWLISPTLDLGGGDAQIHYALWYSNNSGGGADNDLFNVHLSNDDGTNWTLAETIGPITPGGGWVEHTLTVSEFVTPTTQVKIRFEASDLGTGSIVEAGVDDIWVFRMECQQSDCGNGALDPGELCDPAIPPGGPGACPADCSDGDPCDIGTLLDPGTCSARCDFVTITEPIHNDGCCPVGADALTDNDCPGVCGNDLCEEGEDVSCPSDCVCAEDWECSDGNVCTLDQCLDNLCSRTPNKYGDVDHNGAISLFDVFCILNGFAGEFHECTFEDDDLEPCEGDGTINAYDLFAVLNAFGGTDPCCP